MPRVPRLALVVLAVALLVASSSGTAGAKQHKRGGRVPADAASMASGYCEADPGRRYLEVDLQPDAPAPRCWEARPRQRLRVHNGTTAPARLRWKPYAVVTLAPGESVTFDRPFAAYLQPGDHVAHASTYAGGAFEIFLPTTHRHRHPQPVSGG